MDLLLRSCSKPSTTTAVPPLLPQLSSFGSWLAKHGPLVKSLKITSGRDAISDAAVQLLRTGLQQAAATSFVHPLAAAKPPTAAYSTTAAAAAAPEGMLTGPQQQQQQQPGLQPGNPAAAPLLHEAVQLSAALSSSLALNLKAAPEEAAGALQVLVLGLGQQLQAFAEQLLLLQQENQQLQEDGIALAGDFEACATNLQSLAATVAFSIPVGDEVQQGLNSRDAAVFDEQLAALHEAIKVHVESEKALLADSINSGPVAELQGRLHEAEARLAEASGTITQMRHERQEDAARFEEGLVRARNEAADGAEVARKESLAGLKAELAAMKAQLSQLQEVHAAELASLQESSAKALASHVKAADGCIKELEATALGLQGQLAAEVERADRYSKELRRLQAEKERVLALEARKERRQTGEIEGLRERLRGMEAREREQEDELKALKRSLRAKELSLLSSAATSMADR